jgi:hypothetical protein
MHCPNCGGSILGDGVTIALHCERIENAHEFEPDVNILICSDDVGEEPTKEQVDEWNRGEGLVNCCRCGNLHKPGWKNSEGWICAFCADTKELPTLQNVVDAMNSVWERIQ